MWVSVDLCLVPLGVSTSFAPYVALCQKIIEKSGLDYELGPNGTAIEGEWENVFECIRECHEVVHNSGVVRIYTSLKVNTRSDRKQLFREKVLKVQTSIQAKSS